ncbi:FAD-dependent 5-carboxymethylaminomethyl-2-thiouridine(34) oxidoreductase MnmC [Ideonella livida]|uniref:tRNA 5-methylaminomethyl-2-thiouridine biosynthesis bifunctional protein MnmC n=1 Tax=Ideonella livida TaxID=2707176 RepID=A0A7C9TIV9_9BURK|nr:FAD-dependent 5-carboxymethylaminomethyl-2-thiouridine(34) oxidoreductase MnmC [Ideonella livida]NDY89787.1 FAD-dependent 5-carboxymethylaminomethyl-2-thiouridine(34) oxidoreductase MnmC [Ideonella livida]
MQTHPIQPAQVAFDDPAHGGTPYAPDFGDVYHAKAGAFAQARQVFLGGNGLPARWAGRERFVIAETGFGLGNNFLATWQAWREDPQRPARLVFLSVEKHPLRAADLERAHAHSPAPALAHALQAQWPPLTHDLHTLTFDGGAVTLLLALGDAHTWLPQWVAEVDAFYLDGFAPAANARMWDARLLQACGRLAAPDATAATWSAARAVRDGLSAAGFEVRRVPGFGGKRDMTVAGRRARDIPLAHRVPPGRWSAAHTGRPARHALVIGAGLAGASAARALAAQGLRVTVLERCAGAARETSGNPAGIFHPVVHAHDGAHAQLLRAGARRTCQLLRTALAEGAPLPGEAHGLLRGTQAADEGETDPHGPPGADPLPGMEALIARHGLPADWVQALAQPQASALADQPLAGPAWHFQDAGWVSPAVLVHHWLSLPGVTLRTGAEVAALHPPSPDGESNGTPTGWQARDAQGAVLAQADVVVLANARGLAPLLHALLPDVEGWPWGQSRGQVSWWPQEAASAVSLPTLSRPLASGGYALALPPALGGGLLCGATNQREDDDPQVRVADHARNLDRLGELLAAPLPQAQREAALAAGPRGKVGWRLMVDDRLPLMGPVPLPARTLSAQGARRLEQPRFVPRQPGLYLLSALGSRGLTVAPLLGEALAACITGAPNPLPADLLDAVDPARFIARAARRPPTKGQPPADAGGGDAPA